MIEKNFSDRFLAKTSGTNPNSGNTPKAVSNAIKKFGLVDEKEYPMVSTIEEYFKKIPKDILDKGKDFLKEFNFGYEYVNTKDLKNALKRSPVGVAVSAWQQNAQGEYIYFGQWNHWCVLVAFDEKDRPIIWDSYEEGLKTLEKDYNFGFPQIYMLNRDKKVVRISCWQKLLNWFKESCQTE